MTISVVVPAYNEARVIGRLLDALDDPHRRSSLDVVVVCNGCVDGTEDVAAAHPSRPRVLTLDSGSKHAALMAGDAASSSFPRFYVDADVVIAASDLVLLADGLTDGRHAVAPSRDLRLERSAWAVRAYYRLWEELPAVRDGLFGRGVLGVDAEGFSRIAERPDVLGDDLYLHNRFAADERLVVTGAHAVIQGPRTVADLLRRRVRAARGNTQLKADTSSRGTSLGDVLAVVRTHPRLIPSAAAFLLVTITSRVVASRTSGSSWLRDESSRSD